MRNKPVPDATRELAESAPKPRARTRPVPESLMMEHIHATPHIMCPIGRGWLVGWKEIGAYCGFARGKGTGAARTGKNWEVKYGLPVHRLPDNRPRCIPYEVDKWLSAFADLIRGTRPDLLKRKGAFSTEGEDDA